MRADNVRTDARRERRHGTLAYTPANWRQDTPLASREVAHRCESEKLQTRSEKTEIQFHVLQFYQRFVHLSMSKRTLNNALLQSCDFWSLRDVGVCVDAIASFSITLVVRPTR